MVVSARISLLMILWAPPLAAHTADMRRWDWYFRESLAAIRDWETILVEWEKATPEDQRTPLLPLPADGSPITWPNPIPQTLIPLPDNCPPLLLRLVGGQLQITRTQTAETVPLTDTIVGYRHPGGGAKDHWYHGYYRRFDGLTQFRVAPAPFRLILSPTYDFPRGDSRFRVQVESVNNQPLELLLRLEFWCPGHAPTLAEAKLLLAPGSARTTYLPITLQEEGGGLLILHLQADAQHWWLPLFTHVECLSAVLDSCKQILRDYPEANGTAKLKALRAQITHAAGSPSLWRQLFEQASALRDELLLSRLNFETLLFVKRKPYNSEQPFMDAHHLINPPGGAIYRLSPVRPDGKLTPVVDSLGEGIYRDLCLHWDGARFLFAFGNGSDQWDGAQSYHIYEANVDSSGLRQLTFGPHNDAEPFYLPNGQIGFTSDRSEHFVMCGGNRHAPTLFVMEGDGSNPRQFSFNCFNDFNPTVLPDGRILYSRWEYNERSVTSLHNPFTIMPDGTHMAPYYGNATIRPNVVMFPRPVPRSKQIMALFTAHHGQTHGSIGLIDVNRGMDGDDPLTLLTPNIPVTGEKAEDSRYGWYSDPVPLSEDTYLCSYTPTVQPWLPNSWALYVGDRHGNLALLYRDPDISCLEPVPLVPRPAPATLPPAPEDTAAQDATARLLLIDVYEGLPGVPRGEAKYLRILEDVPRKSVKFGGVITTSGTPIYTVKRIFGTVPIQRDGSAHFEIPANRNLYFEVLDGAQLEIQRMRSVVCLKPGETQTCVGCHEPKTLAPVNRFPQAASLPPSRPLPPPWGAQTISFLRDVQPVLNAKCVACHTYNRWSNSVILTDDLTNQFTIGYEELLPYLSVANAMRWDHPEDVYPRPSYTYGSKVSPLMQMLCDGHHGVTLTEEERLRLINWIDANGVYYDRYENQYYPNRQIMTDRVRQPLLEVYNRRCASCHTQDAGSFDTWWLSLNRRDPRLSRALQAPLVRQAGGWGRCKGPVFADTSDPDYRQILHLLSALHGELTEHPREDLLSIRGTAAETQLVVIPQPPATARTEEMPDGWVYLSDLPWESATAGWSPNGDKLPRLNRCIDGSLLRAGSKRYRKGLGTHAPSEIIYRLNGEYARFHAVICGAEQGGTVVFQVFADDTLLFDGGILQGLREVQEIDISVTDAQILRLVVTDAGDNYFFDCANWADARLQRAPQPTQ
ncbi:MAG: NPCBM/NEW2 domain-containing protein [Candidatus Zipacnadales bacterium]